LPSDATAVEILRHPVILQTFQERLDSLAGLSTGQSTRIVRAMLAASPPSIERMEITDKGSINQRTVLKNRAEQIEQLFGQSLAPGVLVVNGELGCKDGR
jgi:feruloyl-CoA synthase